MKTAKNGQEDGDIEMEENPKSRETSNSPTEHSTLIVPNDVYDFRIRNSLLIFEYPGDRTQHLPLQHTILKGEAMR